MAFDRDNPQHDAAVSPFEGPEKLLEIWFAPSPADVPGADTAKDGRYGLRKVSSDVWEEMLDIVKCKVLSVVHGNEMDAYLLRSVSPTYSPHPRLRATACLGIRYPHLPFDHYVQRSTA